MTQIDTPEDAVAPENLDETENTEAETTDIETTETATRTHPTQAASEVVDEEAAEVLEALSEETIDAPVGDPHTETQQTFADFGVSEAIVGSLADVGILHPFPIQALTLPVALQRHDIIGQAKTGTGKTLGFGVPLLMDVVAPGEPGWDELAAPGKPQAVVIVPTRELAVQVAGDLATAARRRSVRIVQVYGGRAYEPQIDQLTKGVEVVVGTPGRMIDLLKQRHLDLSQVRTAVLDEADEMLDLGFLPDVETLMAATSPNRHTMLFSATMPGAVVALARRYMSHPTHIRAHDPDDDGVTLKAITQFVYRAHALDKVEMLSRILQARGRGLTIVFTRTKRTAAKVADELTERGFAAAAIHGDLGQGAREQALRAFRHGKVDVLVATDVAARGIDVDDVTHVVNYQCPEDAKIYLHRVGRTGRAGNTGTAVTFVDWDDVPKWALIDRDLGLDTPNPPETYSSSPQLYADLDIPEGTKGRLPRSERTRAGLEAEQLEDLGETGKRGGRGGAHDGEHGSRGGRTGGAGRDGERRSGGGRAERSERSDRSDRAERPARAEGESDGESGGERRPRRRRRGGGGGAEGAQASASNGSAAPSPSTESAGTSSGVEVGGVSIQLPDRSGPAPDGERAPRRRRRRRGGSGQGGDAAASTSEPVATPAD
ncbi:DEAD/DEAH box helicase [Miniimonas arenae]|uniref:RNA helicase n=1 Tax=Miniimonas arenae TaxID=676201 RepID=A0A5C5BEV3_9MICO|nr:DEAD/DEAH box helicase [Miniimonas arenae]TNU76013.1 DEAD/DEAH box helicase [Miniimonas arenae]